MTTTTFPRRELAIGWHALVDSSKKEALIIGEIKRPGSYVSSGLQLVTKPSEVELMSALDGFGKNVIRRRDVKAK